MSANASKGKIVTLDDYRKDQLRRAASPAAFDPHAIMQRVTRARVAPTQEERLLAASLVLNDAEEMLRVLQVMGGEILTFRQQVKSLAQQSADTATIISLLLHLAGGSVRVNAEWFAAWEPPTGAGFMVYEEGSEIVVRAVVVDDATPTGAPLESATQQTEGDR